MSLKQRISSPLEAGTSILDPHHLPPHILPALKYASERLTRKALHLSLVVVRHEFQLPPSPVWSPDLQASPPGTPSLPKTPKLKLTALRQLVRPSSTPGRILKVDTQNRWNSSKGNNTPSIGSPRTWPGTPLSPPLPSTPCTPSSITSSATATTATTTTTAITDNEEAPTPGSSWGLRFVHTPGLAEREKKAVVAALDRAARKFKIGAEWLPAPISPTDCGLTEHLIQRSVVQNDVLFASEGLTILSLDNLYRLKSALSAYSKTGSPPRLEDAVDELRRLVLANHGRKVTRSELLRTYDWLSVSHASVVDLDQMYKRAYGGPSQVGAIAGMAVTAAQKRHRPMLEPAARSDDGAPSERDRDFDDKMEKEGTIKLTLTTAGAKRKPQSPKINAPVLKLQTTFVASAPKRADEDGESTAKPADQQLPIFLQSWPMSSISQILSATALSPASMSPATRLGPKTPNGYEDISPITRGEWGFLTTDNVFRGNRTAAVETFS